MGLVLEGAALVNSTYMWRTFQITYMVSIPEIHKRAQGSTLYSLPEEEPIQFFSWSISFILSSRHITLRFFFFEWRRITLLKTHLLTKFEAAGPDVPVTCLKFVCWYLSNNISLWNWWFNRKKLFKCPARFYKYSRVLFYTGNWHDMTRSYLLEHPRDFSGFSMNLLC